MLEHAGRTQNCTSPRIGSRAAPDRVSRRRRTCRRSLLGRDHELPLVGPILDALLGAHADRLDNCRELVLLFLGQPLDRKAFDKLADAHERVRLDRSAHSGLCGALQGRCRRRRSWRRLGSFARASASVPSRRPLGWRGADRGVGRLLDLELDRPSALLLLGLISVGHRRVLVLIVVHHLVILLRGLPAHDPAHLPAVLIQVLLVVLLSL
mmetsp:Transcript_12499/g.30666  ORF Transcript_12499/g.30666 Transcript_12499/m.30666 type:complete len:210 (+) Transcript_12499:1061-1690(+)